MTNNKKKNKKGFYLIMGIVLACLIGAIGVVMPYSDTTGTGTDCGDVNCDGKVNMGDVGLLHNYVSYLGKYEICSEWAADVTCDGKIDMGDVILLQNHVTYPDDERYSLRCCEELSIEITNPKDKETVSGIVKVEATASGPNELNDMYLTISDYQVAEHLKLTDCILSVSECEEEYDCKPTYTKTCWYDWDTSNWEGEKVTLTVSISDVKGNKAEDSVAVYVSEEKELDIEITSPGDGETVSGIVKVSATASGSNKLNDMYLTITGYQVAEHIKLTDCVWYCKPVCKPLGTRGEGWYDSCSGELIKYATCAGCTAECAAVGTKSENWHDTCNNEIIKYANCDKTPYGGYCTYNWDTSSWEGEKVTLTASISDVKGNKDSDSIRVYVSKTRDLVDVDIYPEIRTVEIGNLAEYKLVITDNHPIARCGIALADEPVPTEAEIAMAEASTTSAGKGTATRCIVYYTYNLEVIGIPFDAEYPKSVTVYQGSSWTVPLTIKPTYKGDFRFTVKATLSNNPSVHDSDSATLIVNEYRNCNLECRRRGYDYGVCRTSCGVNEYDIGTRYCLQIIDRTLTASKKVAGVKAVSTNPVITAVKAVPVSASKIESVEVDDSIKETTPVGGVLIRVDTTKIAEADTDIYWYPTYHCCCGNKGITVTAWPGKSTYNSGEMATIYAKVYSTDNGDVSAKVTGTIKRPDGEVDTLTFRKICEVREIQKIKDENPAMEISCIGGECLPRCLYVATYRDTEKSGYYSVTVKATSSYGSAETNTGFRVRKELKSCNTYCQGLGYDYGVCRTSCRGDEKNVGPNYCPQLIPRPIESTDESAMEKAGYRYMYCCCGNLVPPPPPGEEIKLELQEGWNLITLPGKGKLSLGTCEALYGFVYIDGEYLSINKAKEKLGEKRLMEYLRKHSFWAYSFRECYLEFTLEEYTSYTELELSKGWNFLPITEDMIGRSLKDIQGNCEFQKKYIWNAKKQRWENIDLEEKFLDGQKFQGFIVKVPSSCSLSGIHIPSIPPLPE